MYYTDRTLVNCRFIGEFDKLDILGEGTYGTVYRAKDKKTGEQVAIKKMKVHDTQYGFPITSLREIKVLKKLEGHPNIITLKDVAVGHDKDSVFLVFEYCQIDLVNLMDQMNVEKLRFSDGYVKCLSLQIIKALCHLHRHYVIHRDLKLSNLLLTTEGLVKLADFGLAREYEKPQKPMTKKVVTLWYRPPELLIYSKNYTKAIDAWSVGCIIAELLRGGDPLFKGSNYIHQFQLICYVIGFPTKEEWPEFFSETSRDLRKYLYKFSVYRTNKLDKTIDKCSAHCIDLLGRLICWSPKKRLDLEKALYHPFFFETPKACFPDELRVLSRLEYLSKKSAYSLLKRRSKNAN